MNIDTIGKPSQAHRHRLPKDEFRKFKDHCETLVLAHFEDLVPDCERGLELQDVQSVLLPASHRAARLKDLEEGELEEAYMCLFLARLLELQFLPDEPALPRLGRKITLEVIFQSLKKTLAVEGSTTMELLLKKDRSSFDDMFIDEDGSGLFRFVHLLKAAAITEEEAAEIAAAPGASPVDDATGAAAALRRRRRRRLQRQGTKNRTEPEAWQVALAYTICQLVYDVMNEAAGADLKWFKEETQKLASSFRGLHCSAAMEAGFAYFLFDLWKSSSSSSAAAAEPPLVFPVALGDVRDHLLEHNRGALATLSAVSHLDLYTIAAHTADGMIRHADAATANAVPYSGNRRQSSSGREDYDNDDDDNKYNDVAEVCQLLFGHADPIDYLESLVLDSQKIKKLNDEARDGTDEGSKCSRTLTLREKLSKPTFPLSVHIRVLLDLNFVDKVFILAKAMEECPFIGYADKARVYEELFDYHLQMGEIFISSNHPQSQRYMPIQKSLYFTLVPISGNIGTFAFAYRYKEIVKHVEKLRKQGFVTDLERRYVRDACHQTLLRIMIAKYKIPDGLSEFAHYFPMPALTTDKLRMWAREVVDQPLEIPRSMLAEDGLPDLYGLLCRGQRAKQEEENRLIIEEANAVTQQRNAALDPEPMEGVVEIQDTDDEEEAEITEKLELNRKEPEREEEISKELEEEDHEEAAESDIEVIEHDENGEEIVAIGSSSEDEDIFNEDDVDNDDEVDLEDDIDHDDNPYQDDPVASDTTRSDVEDDHDSGGFVKASTLVDRGYDAEESLEHSDEEDHAEASRGHTDEEKSTTQTFASHIERGYEAEDSQGHSEDEDQKPVANIESYSDKDMTLDHEGSQSPSHKEGSCIEKDENERTSTAIVAQASTFPIEKGYEAEDSQGFTEEEEKMPTKKETVIPTSHIEAGYEAEDSQGHTEEEEDAEASEVIDVGGDEEEAGTVPRSNTVQTSRHDHDIQPAASHTLSDMSAADEQDEDHGAESSELEEIAGPSDHAHFPPTSPGREAGQTKSSLLEYATAAQQEDDSLRASYVTTSLSPSRPKPLTDRGLSMATDMAVADNSPQSASTEPMEGEEASSEVVVDSLPTNFGMASEGNQFFYTPGDNCAEGQSQNRLAQATLSAIRQLEEGTSEDGKPAAIDTKETMGLSVDESLENIPAATEISITSAEERGKEHVEASSALETPKVNAMNQTGENTLNRKRKTLGLKSSPKKKMKIDEPGDGSLIDNSSKKEPAPNKRAGKRKRADSQSIPEDVEESSSKRMTRSDRNKKPINSGLSAGGRSSRSEKVKTDADSAPLTRRTRGQTKAAKESSITLAPSPRKTRASSRLSSAGQDDMPTRPTRRRTRASSSADSLASTSAPVSSSPDKRKTRSSGRQPLRSTKAVADSVSIEINRTTRASGRPPRAKQDKTVAGSPSVTAGTQRQTRASANAKSAASTSEPVSSAINKRKTRASGRPPRAEQSETVADSPSVAIGPRRRTRSSANVESAASTSEPTGSAINKRKTRARAAQDGTVADSPSVAIGTRRRTRSSANVESATSTSEPASSAINKRKTRASGRPPHAEQVEKVADSPSVAASPASVSTGRPARRRQTRASSGVDSLISTSASASSPAKRKTRASAHAGQDETRNDSKTSDAGANDSHPSGTRARRSTRASSDSPSVTNARATTSTRRTRASSRASANSVTSVSTSKPAKRTTKSPGRRPRAGQDESSTGLKTPHRTSGRKKRKPREVYEPGE